MSVSFIYKEGSPPLSVSKLEFSRASNKASQIHIYLPEPGQQSVVGDEVYR